MAFAQLTYRESLRDIEACLRATGRKLYHLGLRGKVSRSSLADANEAHDWRIYADFAQLLISIARPLYVNESIGFDFDNALHALDSTTIDLCLSLFPWAHFRTTKSAVKLHTLLDLRGNIPAFLRVTTGDLHDVNILDEILPEPGAFYVMDRAYIDFARLYQLHLAAAFFVTRSKRNVLMERRYSRPVDKSTGLRSDQTSVDPLPNSPMPSRWRCRMTKLCGFGMMSASFKQLDRFWRNRRHNRLGVSIRTWPLDRLCQMPLFPKTLSTFSRQRG
jgi:hypothetical protein